MNCQNQNGQGADGVTVLSYAPSDSTPRFWGTGILALGAGIFVPGLGHLIIGRGRRAMFWFLLCIGLTAAQLTSMANPKWLIAAAILLVAEGVSRLWSYADAFLCAMRCKKRLLWHASVRYAAGICLAAFAFAMSPMMPAAEYVRDWYAESFTTFGRAMFPTILPGDTFLVHKQVEYRRWDPVVIRHPCYGQGVVIASRIIGLPGETIEIIDGRIHVNGAVIPTPTGLGPYVNLSDRQRDALSLQGKPGTGCTGNPIRLGSGEYYVLGDNSPTARDARTWDIAIDGHQLGALPASHLIGRVTAIYWPPSRWQILDR